VATAVFQGIPAGGALSRTATSVSAGARTRLANVLLGAILAAVLLTVGGLAARFPLAALAGLLIVIGAQALRPARIARVRHTYPAERVAMGLTFLLSLTVPLHYAILAGVLVTLGLYVYSSSTRIRIVELAPLPDGRREERPASASVAPETATVLQVYGASFFAGVSKLERSLPAVRDEAHAAMILRLRGRDLVGATALAFVERYAKRLRAGANRLLLCGVEPRVMEELEGAGTLEALGRENVFPATAILGESAA
jgi:SulP family sulfate permease